MAKAGRGQSRSWPKQVVARTGRTPQFVGAAPLRAKKKNPRKLSVLCDLLSTALREAAVESIFEVAPTPFKKRIASNGVWLPWSKSRWIKCLGPRRRRTLASCCTGRDKLNDPDSDVWWQNTSRREVRSLFRASKGSHVRPLSQLYRLGNKSEIITEIETQTWPSQKFCTSSVSLVRQKENHNAAKSPYNFSTLPIVRKRNAS